MALCSVPIRDNLHPLLSVSAPSEVPLCAHLQRRYLRHVPRRLLAQSSRLHSFTPFAHFGRQRARVAPVLPRDSDRDSLRPLSRYLAPAARGTGSIQTAADTADRKRPSWRVKPPAHRRWMRVSLSPYLERAECDPHAAPWSIPSVAPRSAHLRVAFALPSDLRRAVGVCLRRRHSSSRAYRLAASCLCFVA